MFAMRLGNERDKNIIAAASGVSQGGAISFLSSIADREAIAFGEAIATPMRMKFGDYRAFEADARHCRRACGRRERRPPGAAVAMRDNPSDPLSKLLIITGGSADDLIKAAQAVALHSEMLDGPQTAVQSVATLPGKQKPDGAPRWARTDQTIALWDYASAEQMQGDGTAPLNVYFHIPPDIYYATERPDPNFTWSTATTPFPSGPSPACKCASTARS